ncbi:caspase family protein [Plectonema cf. radiosum LEGE 06105]|uniref:Caspase family protein n=1 Tax=Plectonema cf. radiosum LEGE 06105 TaxID=945769 RepID=A0A8J7JSQ3_9CYAN|nr:caspase family protein [Plectonema radiosum]MBE9212834.1 caspase family protein [Plectonema cf. radiosum LEGE 06105]
MAGIPPQLHKRLRNVLLECEQFESDRNLKTIFTNESLRPWRSSLPQADSLNSRVDYLIAFLVNKRRSDTKENALVLFVRLLSELIDEADNRHQQLKHLAAELEYNLENNSITNSTPDNRSPEDNPIPENHPIKNRPIKNRWAFLVGVNNYNDPNFGRLNFCVSDVLALEERLKALNYTVVCLHDQLGHGNQRFPSRDNIEAELIRLCEMVEPNDLLLVHFACHGKLFHEKPLLIVNNTRSQTLEKTGLPLEVVKQHMRSSQARRLVLTLDACHMGVETGRDINDDPQFIHNAYDLAEGFALIAASTAQQKAQESKDKKFGVFTYYLLEALSGKADRGSKRFVTVDDIKTYVLDSLKRWSVENGGIIQEPTASIEGFGDIILADYRNS